MLAGQNGSVGHAVALMFEEQMDLGDAMIVGITLLCMNVVGRLRT